MSSSKEEIWFKELIGTYQECLGEEGWTQEELADKSGLHFTYTGQIEKGIRNPSLVNLHPLKVDSGKLLSF